MKTVRQVQRTLRLLAQLSMAATTVAAPLLVGSVVTACDDENDPKTWVKRLDDPAQKGNAIKRLSQFFEDTMARANKNRAAPEIKALLDVSVEPLTKIYVAGGLDEKTRHDLLKFLADTRDMRTAPALKKALDEFDQGKTDDETRFACEAVIGFAKEGQLTDQALTDALWNVFDKYHFSKGGSERLKNDVHDGILAVKSPSYVSKAIAKLAPLVPADQQLATDQLYWQQTSVQLLKELKSPEAVKALVKVLVTPSKMSLNGPVLMALMKMPKEAEQTLIAALNGTDPDIVKAAEGSEDKANIAIVADALAKISRPAGRDAILAALATADTDTARTGLAQALVQFPPDSRAEPAYLAAYKKLAPDATFKLLGMKARYALTQVASQFYDPTLVPWLAKEANSTPDAEGKLVALESALNLFTAANKKDVDGVLAKAAKDLPKDALAAAQRKLDKSAEAVTKCGEDSACYVKLLDDKIVSQPPGSNGAAVKATYMAVIYGGGPKAGATRAELAKRVEKVTDAGTRLALVEAIDKLAQQGDTGAADTIDKVVAADKDRGAVNMKDGSDDAAAKVALRLRARALP